MGQLMKQIAPAEAKETERKPCCEVAHQRRQTEQADDKAQPESDAYKKGVHR